MNLDTKAILKNTQLQIDLDLEKFSDINSTKSEISQKSTNSSNKPFKVLMAEDYKEYLEKIKKFYTAFKFNHYSKYYTMIKNSYICNSSFNNNISMNYLKNLNEETQILQKMNEPYIPSNKFKEIKLNSEFFNSEEEFKIDRLILEKKVEDLEIIMKQFIERGGVIEMEVQRILVHSGLILSYIENNLNLKSEVDFFLDRIKTHKERKDLLKKVLIVNSCSMILKENKKRKLENLKEIMEGLKNLKDITENIKYVKNLQDENDFINIGTKILSEMRNKNLNINIISIIEKEFDNYSSKSSNKIIEEFSKYFKKTFSDLISFDNSIMNNINYVRRLLI